MNVKVGDKAVMSGYSQVREVTIEKVGRKYVYADRRKFDRTNGYGDFGFHLYTVEGWATKARADTARKALATFGVELRRASDTKTLAVYEALKPLMWVPE